MDYHHHNIYFFGLFGIILFYLFIFCYTVNNFLVVVYVVAYTRFFFVFSMPILYIKIFIFLLFPVFKLLFLIFLLFLFCCVFYFLFFLFFFIILFCAQRKICVFFFVLVFYVCVHMLNNIICKSSVFCFFPFFLYILHIISFLVFFASNVLFRVCFVSGQKK